MAAGEARLRAIRMAERGYHAAAIEAWCDYLSEVPDDAAAHAALALSLQHEKRIYAARHEAKEALRLDPEQTAAMLVFALVSFFENRHDRAIEQLDHLLAIDPLDGEALLVKAQIQRARGRHAQAQAALDEVLELAPSSSAVLLEQARLWRDRGERGQAEQLARSLITADPGSADALVLLGNLRHDAGDAQGALDLALAALQIDPMSDDAFSLLGQAKISRFPLAGLVWAFPRLLARFEVNQRVWLLCLIYLAYMMTQTVLAWYRAPMWSVILFSALYLVVGLGAYLSDAIVAWLVRRELRRVEFRRAF